MKCIAQRGLERPEEHVSSLENDKFQIPWAARCHVCCGTNLKSLLGTYLGNELAAYGPRPEKIQAGGGVALAALTNPART